MSAWGGIIAYEGLRSVDGRLLEHEALQVEGQVPLVTPGDRGVGFVEVGYLSIIRRRRVETVYDSRDAFALWGYGEIDDGYLSLPRGLAPNVDSIEVAPMRLGDELAFSSARLRQVVLTSTPGWPGCILEPLRVVNLTDENEQARAEAEVRWPAPHPRARNANERRANMIHAAHREGYVAGWLRRAHLNGDGQ